MKYIEEYLKDVIKIKPLGELTTREDILNGMSGEMVYIDGKCSDIFISHADYANWLEKQRGKEAKGNEREIPFCRAESWSEADEMFLKRAIKATKDVYPVTAYWLKSLKDRIKGE